MTAIDRFQPIILRCLEREFPGKTQQEPAFFSCDGRIRRAVEAIFSEVTLSALHKPFLPLICANARPLSSEIRRAIFHASWEARLGKGCFAAVFEIVKFCAKRSVKEVAANIQGFGIQDQDALVELAKMCARYNGMAVAMYIQNFGIHAQDALVELAKMCARRNGKATAMYIQNFDIQDKRALIEIARICARQNSKATEYFIQNFGIQDMASLSNTTESTLSAQADVQKAYAVVEIGEMTFETDSHPIEPPPSFFDFEGSLL
jgi:hypothetical protein